MNAAEHVARALAAAEQSGNPEMIALANIGAAITASIESMTVQLHEQNVLTDVHNKVASRLVTGNRHHPF